MTEPVVLSPAVLARIEDDPSVKIVPIGARVPKVLRLWLNRDAVVFLAQNLVQFLYKLPNSGDACALMAIPVAVVRAGEEPVTQQAGGSRIIKPDAIIPDIGGEA
jgi:hypothetical protein